MSKSKESQLRVSGKDLGERICGPSTQVIYKTVWVYEFSEQRGQVSMRFSNGFSDGPNGSEERWKLQNRPSFFNLDSVDILD